MKDAADPAGIIRSIKSLKKAGINIDTIMAAARKLAEPDLIRLGRLTKKGIPSGLVESLIKHGDDFAKYSDEFLLLIKDTSKSYDDILKYASKYGDDFVKAYKKYGDKAVDAFSEYGDGALDWLKKNYGDYSVKPTKEGLDTIRGHLSGDMQAEFNDAMIRRIDTMLNKGEELIGADANFYLHEIGETELMNMGYEYKVAHNMMLEKYSVTEFDLYHPDVIKEMPEWFGKEWFIYWGIE